jgi:hypothetical protein
LLELKLRRHYNSKMSKYIDCTLQASHHSGPPLLHTGAMAAAQGDVNLQALAPAPFLVPQLSSPGPKKTLLVEQRGQLLLIDYSDLQEPVRRKIKSKMDGSSLVKMSYYPRTNTHSVLQGDFEVYNISFDYSGRNEGISIEFALANGISQSVPLLSDNSGNWVFPAVRFCRALGYAHPQDTARDALANQGALTLDAWVATCNLFRGGAFKRVSCMPLSWQRKEA